MPILKIEGVPPLDGDYPLDISSFTNRELHLIKQETGVRAGEIGDAFAAGDSDLMVAIALIVLQRNGKGQASQLRDIIWDADVGALTFDMTDDEKAEAESDALPPASEPTASGKPDAASGSSGSSSGNGSESPASVPSPTGPRRSATGAT